MLKRTMICALTFSMAQSLALFAQEGEGSGLLDDSNLGQTDDLITQQEADIDQIEPGGQTAAIDMQALSGVDQTDTDKKSTLDQQVQKLKQQVLELNKDLFILEEELLFPANTQVAIYLSMDVGEYFQLDAVKLTIDDKVVTNYLYTSRQVDALLRGGVQRLHLGNLKTGEHEIVAVFTGRGPKKRDFRRATTLKIDKTSQAKQIELKIVDSTATQQPEFVVKEW